MDTPQTCNPEEMGLLSLSAPKSAHLRTSQLLLSSDLPMISWGHTVCREEIW